MLPVIRGQFGSYNGTRHAITRPIHVDRRHRLPFHRSSRIAQPHRSGRIELSRLIRALADALTSAPRVLDSVHRAGLSHPPTTLVGHYHYH